MPELPEVEVITRQLEPLITGKTISSIKVLLKKSFIGETKELIGKKIIGIDRRGKVLIIRLQSSSIGLYIHLRMSGQLLFKNQLQKVSPFEAEKPPHRHLRIIIHFTDQSQLQFIDQRTFGFITTNQNIIPKGIDALDPSLTVSKLKEILSKSKKSIKTLLLDQTKIAGIGNIYASEILWEARINPKLGHLGDLGILQKAIRKILFEAIKYGGSTMSDQLYRQVGGETGGYQKRFHVYDRAKKPCLRCKTPIRKIKLGQRSTYFCPKCQAV